MDEDDSRTIQVVAGITAVVIITSVALFTQTEVDFVVAVLGSAFTLIAALLGVQYTVKSIRKSDREREWNHAHHEHHREDED